MQLQIESTDEVTEIDGVPARHWVGTTPKGVECHVFVHRIAVGNDKDQKQFDEELREMPQPRRVPLGRILS